MQSEIETPQDTNKSIKLSLNGVNLDQPIIMGILNVTPDSFFDGGQHINDADIIRKVNSMEFNGAQIIDIGGYSSRPGAAEISEEEELKRVLPIVKLIRSNFSDLLISIIILSKSFFCKLYLNIHFFGLIYSYKHIFNKYFILISSFFNNLEFLS